MSSVNVRLGPSFSWSTTTVTEWQGQKKIGRRRPIKNSVYPVPRRQSTLIHVVGVTSVPPVQKGSDEARKEEDLAECLRRAPCPRLRRSEAASLSPHPTRNPAFPVSSLPRWGKHPRQPPRHPLGERENPRPFTGLLAVAAVSYLGLRGAPLYRRTATLSSPPHLLHSVSYSLSFRLGLTLPTIFLPPIFSRSPSFSPLDVLPASVYPDFSPTHSPTSVTRDCRDSENIDAVGRLPRLLASCEAYGRAGSTRYWDVCRRIRVFHVLSFHRC